MLKNFKAMVPGVSALVVVVAAALSLQACSDPVADELVAYKNENVQPILEEIKDSDTRFQGFLKMVSAGDVSDADAVSYIDSELMAPARKLNEKIQAIHPEAEEIAEVHELLISAHQNVFNSYVMASSAFEKHDMDAIVTANEKTAAAQRDFRDFTRKLEALYKKHDVPTTGQD